MVERTATMRYNMQVTFDQFKRARSSDGEKCIAFILKKTAALEYSKLYKSYSVENPVNAGA